MENSHVVLKDLLMAKQSTIITCISSALSIVCGLAIIWTYRGIPSIQSYTRYLLVCLTISDIFIAFGNFASTMRWFYIMEKSRVIQNDFYCTAQSFVTTTASMCSFFWTIEIAVYLFMAVIFSISIQEHRILKYTMTFVPVVIPFSIGIIAASYGVLGEDKFNGSGPWCWIKNQMDKETAIKWKLVTGKGWELLAYIIPSVIYILLKFFSWRENRRRQQQFQWSSASPDVRDEDFIFGIAWLFLLVARIWGTSRFILKSDDDVHYPRLGKALLYLQCVGDSSQAFWNFLFFFWFDSNIRKSIINRVKLCFRRSYHGNDLENLS